MKLMLLMRPKDSEMNGIALMFNNLFRFRIGGNLLGVLRSGQI